jgi:hypothetical protein
MTYLHPFDVVRDAVEYMKATEDDPAVDPEDRTVQAAIEGAAEIAAEEVQYGFEAAVNEALAYYEKYPTEDQRVDAELERVVQLAFGYVRKQEPQLDPQAVVDMIGNRVRGMLLAAAEEGASDV